MTPAVTTRVPVIRINGQADDRVTGLALTFQMSEKEGGLSSLEMTFSNVATEPSLTSYFAFDNEVSLSLGMEISLYGASADGSSKELFRGPITAIEGRFGFEAPPELKVLAEDALQKARMARRSKVYDNATIGDIAREVASALSLRPVITGFTAPIGTQVQLDESDLAFLRRLLARYDGDVQVVGQELHVTPRGDVVREPIPLKLYDELLRVRVISDLSHQATAVSVAGWDAKQGEPVSFTATGPAPGQPDGTTGREVLLRTLGERSEHVAHLSVLNLDEATAVATAAMDHRARRFVRLDATATGNPDLRVGSRVRLTGTGRRFDNTYYVVEAVHRWDQDRGYETDFIGECAFVGVV